MHQTWTGDLSQYDNIHVSMLFSQIIPPSPLLGSFISRYSFHSLKKSNNDIKKKKKKDQEENHKIRISSSSINKNLTKGGLPRKKELHRG